MSHGLMLKTVLFPITVKELVISLEKIGYQINPTVPSPLPIGRISVTGELARKGKISLVLETGSKILFVSGLSGFSTTVRGTLLELGKP